MEKSQSTFLSEIRETLDALKAQIADIEAKLAEFEAVDDVPAAAPVPEDLPSWDPIDISIDIEPIADFTEQEPQPVSLEQESQPVSLEQESQPVSLEQESQPVSLEQESQEQPSPETSSYAGPLPSDDGPLPLMMPRVAQFPETLAPETPVVEDRGDLPASEETKEEEPKSLEDVFGQPQESINDKQEKKARKAVIDVMGEKCAWKTAIPGTPVKNIISAISLNDRVLFINTLFKEDPMAFQQTISAFNGMETLDEAVAYVQEHHSDWNLNSDVVYRLMMAVRRKLR